MRSLCILEYSFIILRRFLRKDFKGEFRRKLEDERVGNWVGEGMERRILFEKMKFAWFEILRVDLNSCGIYCFLKSLYFKWKKKLPSKERAFT